MPAAKEDQVVVPDKKPYRVTIVGASYIDPIEGYGPDGSPTLLQVYKMGRFGETIELTERQANRLLDLEAVKPLDEPLSYDEMKVGELEDLANERGIDVTGSGANGAALKEDYVNALVTYDQGQGAAAA